MDRLAYSLRCGAFALLAFLAGPGAAMAADQAAAPCTEDAMIVFDASGSMAGSLAEGIGAKIRRIDEVRKALAQALPRVMRFRRIGLITYGPGSYRQCNVELKLRPEPNAAQRILNDVSTLNPSGKTPLAAAVQQAAEVLDFRAEPGVVVLLTDGEETCDGAPCALGKILKAEGLQLTVHVIGFRMTAFWTGAQSALDVRCLAEETGGLYIAAEDQEELVEAFEKSLGCPMMSEWVRR
ncbi:MAG: vWA domain-containing protein [Methyloceanibacter sp.]|uniref:vWA domain-containing protein n=1 Tax=Methyloceanibacter sp. TaxID=1965321 RepID=UPI003D6D1A76